MKLADKNTMANSNLTNSIKLIQVANATIAEETEKLITALIKRFEHSRYPKMWNKKVNTFSRDPITFWVFLTPILVEYNMLETIKVLLSENTENNKLFELNDMLASASSTDNITFDHYQGSYGDSSSFNVCYDSRKINLVTFQ